MDQELTGALAGVKVLDLSRYAPGLFATALLADLGADVLTVEPKAAASDAPELPLYGGPAARAAGSHPLWRRRRAVALDIKSREGREAVLDLARDAEVLVEGFRPGVAGRLGLGFDDLRSINERIVYCSITGYGQRGPHSSRAGHDLNYLAETGMLSVTTRPGQRPGIPLNLVADMAAGGLAAAFNVLAAMRKRDHTGEAVHVDVSMARSVLAMLAPAVAGMEAGGFDISWAGGMLSGAAPFYDCYATSDGGWMSVAAIEPKFFEQLCVALGIPELAPAQLDEGRWDEVRLALAEVFATATRDEWVERLAGVDAATSPVLSVGEAFDRWKAAGTVSTDGEVSVVAPGLEGGP